MTDTVVRYRPSKLTFETMVDLEAALKLRKGEKVNINDVIRDKFIYTDIKKGMKAGNSELINTFGTTEFEKIVEIMIKKGNIEIPQEFRDEVLENRKKQIIDFLSRNAIDTRTGRFLTPDLISNSLKEAGVKIENQPIEKQIMRIVDELKKVIPIKISSKKIKIKVPPQYTAHVYGIIKDYKEKEEWLNDGSLEAILNVPIGIQTEFYDKLNSITHGSIITTEIKE